jgi:hypothetical protein
MNGSFPIGTQTPFYPNVMKPTSIEKSTPPIGEPNATATPAALAAVKISRIFAKKQI